MPHQIFEADLYDPKHCAAIVQVIDSFASDPTGGGKPLSAEARTGLIPLLREHTSSFVLLAACDTVLVGMCLCVIGISTFRARPVLNVADLAVLPGYRGKGLGRALLAFAEREALARGCCRLSIEVQQDNAPAIGLYRSFGFQDLVVGDSDITRFLVKSI